MCVFSACMLVHHVHSCCLWKSEEGIGSPATGVTDGCDPPSGFWEPTLSPLHEQQVLLTTKLFPVPYIIFFGYFISLIYAWVFFLHVCLYMQCTQGQEDGNRYCGPGVEDGG